MRSNQLLLGFLLLTFASCDPFHSLVVSNASKEDKRIQIVLPPEAYNAFPLRDSLLFESQDKKDNIPTKTVKRPVNQDSLTKSYSFVLPSNQNAILESGFGARPILNQKIIIDNTDTIIVKPKAKRVKKKPKLSLGGEYKVTITD